MVAKLFVIISLQKYIVYSENRNQRSTNFHLVTFAQISIEICLNPCLRAEALRQAGFQGCGFILSSLARHFVPGYS